MGRKTDEFCVQCGCPGPLIGPVCSACYIEMEQPLKLPEYVDVEHCPVCHARKRKATWIDFEDMDQAVEDAVMEAVSIVQGLPDPVLSIGLRQQDKLVYVADVEAIFIIDDAEVAARAETTVRVKQNVCGRCSRAAGNYYEAILQIRTSARDLDPETMKKTQEIIQKHIAQRQTMDRNVFISKIEQVKGGTDFYVSSVGETRVLANKLADRNAVKVHESPKLVGRQDGRNIYRVTFLVRLPNVTIGDFLMIKQGPVMVMVATSRKLKVMGLLDHRVFSIENETLPDSKVFHKDEHIHEAVVVSVEPDGSELELMDPVGYQSRTLRIPKEYPEVEAGQTVKAVRIEDELYLLPWVR